MTFPYLIAQGGGDFTPSAFNFTCCAGVNPSTATVSNSYTPICYNSPSAISISAGAYCVSGLGWSSSAGTIKPGCSVAVCMTSATYSSGCCSVLTIGSPPITAGFCLVTRALDATPDAFCACCYTGANLSVACCNTVTITGIDCATVNASGATTVSVNVGGFGIGPCCICASQTMCIKTSGSSSYSTTCTGYVCVGTCTATGTVATRAIDTTPDAFCFCCWTNVPVSPTCCNVVTITGIDCATVNASGAATMSVNGGGFGVGPCCICASQTLCMKIVGSASYSTTCTGYVCVGGCTATGGITTCAAPPIFAVVGGYAYSGSCNYTTQTVGLIDVQTGTCILSGVSFCLCQNAASMNVGWNGTCWIAAAQGLQGGGYCIKVYTSTNASSWGLTGYSCVGYNFTPSISGYIAWNPVNSIPSQGVGFSWILNNGHGTMTNYIYCNNGSRTNMMCPYPSSYNTSCDYFGPVSFVPSGCYVSAYVCPNTKMVGIATSTDGVNWSKCMSNLCDRCGLLTCTPRWTCSTPECCGASWVGKTASGMLFILAPWGCCDSFCIAGCTRTNCTNIICMGCNMASLSAGFSSTCIDPTPTCFCWMQCSDNPQGFINWPGGAYIKCGSPSCYGGYLIINDLGAAPCCCYYAALNCSNRIRVCYSLSTCLYYAFCCVGAYYFCTTGSMYSSPSLDGSWTCVCIPAANLTGYTGQNVGFK